jgi:hypothetical protein
VCFFTVFDNTWQYGALVHTDLFFNVFSDMNYSIRKRNGVPRYVWTGLQNAHTTKV